MNYKGFVFFFCCFHCWDNYAVAQNKLPRQSFPNEALVIYNYKSNGKNIEGRTLFLAYKNNLAILTDSNSSGNEGRIIDFNKKATFQTIRMKNGEKFTLKNPFSKYERPTITGDTASILGIPCRKAKLVIRSNSIEVWFTNAIQVKGTPSLGIAPGLGLILKIVRNGNFEIYASKIELGKVPDSLWQKPGSYGRIVDEATFRRKEIDNRYFSFPVFDHQQINFTDSISNPVEGLANVTYRYAGGTVVLKKVKLPDTEDFNVFINLTQYSNGDAYDRTGTVFIIPTDKKISFLNGLKYGIKELPVYTDKSGHKYQGVVAAPDYSPPLELMRFFTPFGVRAYNGNVQIAGYHWADSVNYKQDVTDLISRLKGEGWIGAFIGNYDKGGHIINLQLDYYPKTDEPVKKYWVEPVFNTLNIMEMAGQAYGTMFADDSLTVTIDVPDNLKNLQLRYISTGHGGWEGGDEFNQKENDIIVDGKRVYHFIPWRTDCGTYRRFNPASGNFGDGLSSSDLSRSNWCPGTTTNPVYIPLNLSAGTHTLKIAIPMGKPEGSSFSSWNVSGVLMGELNSK